MEVILNKTIICISVCLFSAQNNIVGAVQIAFLRCKEVKG